jgi:hypothetical protein
VPPKAIALHKTPKRLNIIGHGKPRKRIPIFYSRSGLDTMSAHGPLPMRLPSLSLISNIGQADPILAITPSLSRGDLDSLHTHLTQSCMSCTVGHIHPQRIVISCFSLRDSYRKQCFSFAISVKVGSKDVRAALASFEPTFTEIAKE